MSQSIEVLLTPAEFRELGARDVRQTTCVVFDVLRATSSMVTALAHGATSIHPAADIPEALRLREQIPDALLAGERDGLRITAGLTGGVEFDLGNSPREFTRNRVLGRPIIMSTTNGTRALRACRGAQEVLVASLLNLGAVAAVLHRWQPADLLLICAGTVEQASFEDTVAAGALCDLLWPCYGRGDVADSAALARELYLRHADNVGPAIASHARNARRLLARPELAADVAFCLRRDVFHLAPRMASDGAVRWVA
ncbi:MAG: 2-phosphosulfolactate phosphatase [Verrucomicrobia bacterium]|jgi:2-phosphosulfolactate phosphatase|nr:2-phosphosulfolactate phosphatase [Verrucomicrobiota bacterium]